MGWKSSINQKGNDLIFKQAWAKGQKIRSKTEDALGDFFEELVTVGIDVAEPPSLGKFTPTWEPLSTLWTERKGNDEFYYGTTTGPNKLLPTLLRKNAINIFGRPQVTLNFNGQSVKINAGQAAKKYQGAPLTKMSIDVNPFPRLDSEWNSAESLTAVEGSKTYYKLVNPNGMYMRPLIGPFVQWWLHVRLKKLLKTWV